ncbi:uncharacterized protein LOC143145076 [Ptiloglossa arizonensis]|uniref:uncharacterized protein LOC143145076 n=1 Tax=Ptiloglossa arizonensis TaxID=3350558 RepID=UPI003FA03DEC
MPVFKADETASRSRNAVLRCSRASTIDRLSPTRAQNSSRSSDSHHVCPGTCRLREHVLSQSVIYSRTASSKVRVTVRENIDDPSLPTGQLSTLLRRLSMFNFYEWLHHLGPTGTVHPDSQARIRRTPSR